MKIEFSTHWKGSKQPRKQRKYSANAPLHIKNKLLSANLSKELRKKYGKRNVPIRKGDNVKIMKGKFKKKQGKILEVDTKDSRVIIEGVQVKKQDGSKANVKMHPSNLQILDLNIEDKRRIKEISKKEIKEEQKKNKEEKKAEKKPEEKAK